MTSDLKSRLRIGLLLQRDLAKILMGDLVHARDLLQPLIDGKLTPIGDRAVIRQSFPLRLYISTFVALVEGLTFTMRNSVNLFGELCGVSLSARERARLVERRYDRNADAVMPASAHNDVKTNIKLAFRYFPQMYESDFKLDTNSQNWQNFLQLLNARHALTHPKTLEALCPLEGLEVLGPATTWFFDSYFSMLDRCARGAGVPIDVDIQFDVPTKLHFPEKNPPEDFYDVEVPRIGLRSFELFTTVVLGLMEDRRDALSMVTEASQGSDFTSSREQFALRSAVRTLFWSVEGVTYAMRRFLTAAENRGDVELWPRDHQWLDKKDSVCKQYMRTLRIFNREFCRKARLNTKSVDWRKFQECLKIRDHLTHPKAKADLEVDVSKLDVILRARAWIAHSMGALKIRHDLALSDVSREEFENSTT